MGWGLLYISANGCAGVLTIYMKKPEIPVGKSNGTHHSIWSTSEIMGFWSK